MGEDVPANWANLCRVEDEVLHEEVAAGEEEARDYGQENAQVHHTAWGVHVALLQG